MRGARLQAQDLGRTNQFVNTLLSKNDVKDLEKPDLPDSSRSQPMVNGNGVPFRHDPKARFSEPPAPPPQQPLPEKPDSPALKRSPIDRPKSGPPNTSPVRQENMNQIVQLTETLNNAKRDIDSQTTRIRELENMLQNEREARALAEDLAKRLEESATSHVNGAVVLPAAQSVVESSMNGPEEDDTEEADETVVEPEIPTVEDESAKETAIALQTRIDTMEEHMKNMQEQMEMWKQRCEKAESARDADRKTLEEMVVQLRAEEARRVSRERRSRSRKRAAETKANTTQNESLSSSTSDESPLPQADGSGSSEDAVDEPNLSRANTITPYSANRGTRAPPQHLQAGLPYASALGVVLIGMGLMAYINGWQAPTSRVER